jgi:hypothetical protein
MSGILIQSTFGTKGNFEVVVPRVGGGADHFGRDNDAPGTPWFGPITAFGSRDDVTYPALIQQRGGELVAVRREAAGIKVIERKAYTYNGAPMWRWQASVSLSGANGAGRGVSMCQSRWGTAMSNFEVVAPQASGLAHWARNNDIPSPTWSGPNAFGSGTFLACAVINSNFGTGGGNLEVVAWLQNIGLVHFVRDSSFNWTQTATLPNSGDVSGPPALIQSSFGTKGNFEVVAPVAAGGFAHWARNNDSGTFPWGRTATVGTGAIRGIGLIQSNYGTEGNFEVVGDMNGSLKHWWRSDTGPWPWSTATTFWTRPAPPPASAGDAAIVAKPDGAVGIHLALLRTGRVLMFGFDDRGEMAGPGALTFDPATNVATAVGTAEHLFCSGHASIPDGRILVIGDHTDDVRAVHLFDPATNTFQRLPDLSDGRWYPTVTCLTDGRMLIISGTREGGPWAPFGGAHVNETTQLFNPATSAFSAPVATPSPFDGSHPVDLYPFVFQLPDGRVLVHSRSTTRFWSATTGWEATQLHAVRSQSRVYPGQGTAVLLPLRASEGFRARVLLIGGGGLDREQYFNAANPPDTSKSDEPATAAVEQLDLGSPTPAWTARAPMKRGRVLCESILLPDGTVLVLGGSARGKSDWGTVPVFPVERYDPVANTWTDMAAIDVPRMYHSAALLMADGRVLATGKDGQFQLDPYKYYEHRLETFSPPYLFAGARPQITSAPTTAAYGAVVSVGFSGPVPSRVALVRTGSVTHGFNMDQRLVEPLSAVVGSTVTVTMPPNGQIAPPGHYMLFLVTAQGVPSVGQIFRLG